MLRTAFPFYTLIYCCAYRILTLDQNGIYILRSSFNEENLIYEVANYHLNFHQVQNILKFMKIFGSFVYLLWSNFKVLK